MDLSIIIPWYGAPVDVMERHFEAITGNTLKPVEIIIANDGWQQDTELILLIERYSKIIPFVYVNILEDVPWNMAECLNLGLWLTKAGYVSIEDCDILPSPTYYETAMIYMKAGISKYIAHYDNEPGYPCACGVYSRETLTDVGGFEEDFSGSYGFNDIYLSAKMNMKGFKTYLSFDKLITVLHGGTSQNVSRDNSRNRELMTELLKTYPCNLNLFRYPYKITRYA